MIKPGWYNDPQDLRQERYFDGHRWTDRVRADIPDIPLAPWVDPSHPDYAVGHIVDTSPPTSSVRSWITAIGGLALVAVALTIGIVKTNEMKAQYEAVGGQWPIDVELPPTSAGAAVVPPFTCQDVQDSYNDSLGLGIVGFAGGPTTLADHQPITALPTGQTHYLMLRCEMAAMYEDGSGIYMPMALVVDANGALTTLIG